MGRAAVEGIDILLKDFCRAGERVRERRERGGKRNNGHLNTQTCALYRMVD